MRSGFLEAVNMANLEMTDSAITDAIAPLTSVMHSTASTLVMKLIRTTVYCKTLYTPQDGITYLNVSTPPLELSKLVEVLDADGNVEDLVVELA